MAELSESNSWNILPTRLIALSDGASVELSATLCFFATASRWGTAIFDTAASATQSNTIGNADPTDACAESNGRWVRCSALLKGHPDLSRQ